MTLSRRSFLASSTAVLLLPSVPLLEQMKGLPKPLPGVVPSGPLHAELVRITREAFLPRLHARTLVYATNEEPVCFAYARFGVDAPSEE